MTSTVHRGMMKTAEIDPETKLINVKFGGADFHATLKKVKQLEGRVFVSEKRIWTVPKTQENIDALMKYGFSLVGPGWKDRKDIPTTPRKEIDKSKIDSRLYKYQIEGVEFLEATNGQGLVADSMGLGKSATVVTWLMLHPEARPALVVCPASIKTKWQRELKTWGKLDSYIWPEGSQLDENGIFVINYDQLIKYEETEEEFNWRQEQKQRKEEGLRPVKRDFPAARGELSKYRFKVVVGDEIHYTANDSLRSRYFVRIARYAEHRIFMSGTPIRNRPAEFFNTLNLLAPQVFPNRWQFMMSHAAPQLTRFGWKFNGASNLTELHNKVAPLMIRHLKEDVMKELPPKRKMVIPLDLDDVEAREYWNADAEFMEWVASTKQRKLEIQNHMALLRQLAYQAKRNSLFEWIDSWLDENPDEKIVLFGYHLRVLDDLEERYKKISVRIDGSVSPKERQGIIDKFQEDPKVRVFIGQINAAGVGIDLTASATVVFTELTWVPGDMEQAEDRAHRITSIGRERVDIIYLTAAGTFEDDLAEALIEKYKIVKKVLDNHENSQFFSGQYLLDEVIAKRRKQKTA